MAAWYIAKMQSATLGWKTWNSEIHLLMSVCINKYGSVVRLVRGWHKERVLADGGRAPEHTRQLGSYQVGCESDIVGGAGCGIHTIHWSEIIPKSPALRVPKEKTASTGETPQPAFSKS